MIAVPGQPRAERVLRAALALPSPPQQLLIHGPPGTGKREAARRVAWALVDPGGRHDPHEESLDITVVAPAGHLIRLDADLEPALAALAARPVVGERRVLILDGAERLREQEGAPRILKQLEEPPPRSHILLVTDRAGDLLPTIRSRCLPVPFRPPGWRAIAGRLVEGGMPPEEAEGMARADGPLALTASPFARRMRSLGLELGLRALAGGDDRLGLVRGIEAAMGEAAAEHPSPELERLRDEAAALAGRRGERTALKRVEDQEKRERRRLVTDGWSHVLNGAVFLVMDALAVAWGAEEAVRHRDRLEALRAVAAPGRRPFLERAAEEIQLTRAELVVNPTTDLAVEAMLRRIDLARLGAAGPLIAPGRLGF